MRTVASLLLFFVTLVVGCGASPKVVAISTVDATCEQIEQHIEDQNPCTTDLETVQGQLACTRATCDELVRRLETRGGDDAD